MIQSALVALGRHLDLDRTELNNLSRQEPERVNSMAVEWFCIAKDVDRLKGRSLTPVGDKLKTLNFRKDTSSGSAQRK